MCKSGLYCTCAGKFRQSRVSVAPARKENRPYEAREVRLGVRCLLAVSAHNYPIDQHFQPFTLFVWNDTPEDVKLRCLIKQTRRLKR